MAVAADRTDAPMSPLSDIPRKPRFVAEMGDKCVSRSHIGAAHEARCGIGAKARFSGNPLQIL